MAPRVVVFGGQGSKALFSSTSIASLRSVLVQSPAASLFLAKCHSAWLHAIESLDSPARIALDLDVLHFHEAGSLLDPPERYRRHGVVQATSLFTAQLIQFIACSEARKAGLQTPIQDILEATGFCAGLLPAVAVACSADVGQLVDIGIELFRLCFWIALRSTQSVAASAVDPGSGTWSLVISGTTEEALGATVTDFCAKTGCHTVQISAVCTADTLSLSGAPQDLERFRQYLPLSVGYSSPLIHSWYHGGPQLLGVLSLIEKDIGEQRIRVPSSDRLRIVVRSTFDHQVITGQCPPTCMGLWIARNMIIHRVNWRTTVEEIKKHCFAYLAAHSLSTVTVESYGPGSQFLLSGYKDSSPQMHLVDRSPFTGSYPMDTDHADSIAIVGMSVKVPGANNTDEFAEMLLKGHNIVQEIPLDRFDASLYQTESGPGNRQINARHGAFLDDVWTFDNGFFSISPREAVSMDPQQRLLLHAVQVALDSAGYVADSTPSFQRSSMGCYIGLATGDYTDNLRNEIDVFYSPGTLRAFHSGRIAYSYRMSGPCMTIDTACSSSLVSISQACKAIQNGDCTSAIAGGVNVICSPDMQIGLDRGHFLSSTGGCKPFDAAADGYCRAEGVVVFVLKRLADAVAENDRIHGIIRGTVINQSGNSHSITHPHSPTQVQLIDSLLKRTRVSADAIDVVEAHGTGTQAGDAREHESLATAFEGSHTSNNPLIVSSVKGNIGHAEAASGAVGLAKLVLMMENQIIYKQANLRVVNPKIPPHHQKALKIPLDAEVWSQHQAHPRRAILNNFGAAGSNCALLLEQAQSIPETAPTSAQRSAYVFNLSGKSPAILQESIQDHLMFLQSHDLNLRDICYTATARRPSYDYGVVAAVSSTRELIEKLPSLNVYEQAKVPASNTSVFVFSGQGAIYTGMGRELMETSQYFAEIVRSCNTIVTNLGLPDILPFITSADPPRVPLDEELVLSHCACVALQYALARLIISWGVTPSCVVGHSLGEFAALAVCGALTIEEVITFVACRAKLMTIKCTANESGMLAVKLSAKDFLQLLSNYDELKGLELACINSPNDIVIAGSVHELELLEQRLASASTKSQRLAMAYGFHSRFMDPILSELTASSRSLSWNEPKIPFFSAVFGRLAHLAAGDRGLGSDYLSRHARQPVMFSAAIQAIEFDGLFQDSSCLEIGPHPILTPMIRASASGSKLALPTLQKGKDSWWTLCNTLAALCASQGAKLSWREVFASSDAKLVNLPGYPLRGSRYTVTYVEPARDVEPSTPVRNDSTALSSIFLSSRKLEAGTTFRTSTQIIGRLIAGHDVGGIPICPASVYWVLATEGARLISKPEPGRIAHVENMVFAKPFVHVSGDNTQVVECFLSEPESDSKFRFQIRSTGSSTHPSLHCSGEIRFVPEGAMNKSCARDAALVKRQANYIRQLDQHKLSRFQTRLLYDVVFPRVVQYAPEYQSLTDLSVSYESLEGLGLFQLPPDLEAGAEYEQIARWTDVLFHAAGFIANTSHSPMDVYICADVCEFDVHTSSIKFEEAFDVYCSLLDVGPDTVSADAYAMTKSGRIVASGKSMVFKRVTRTKFQQHISSLRARGPKLASVVKDVQIPTSVVTDRDGPKPLNSVLPTPQVSSEQSVLEVLSSVSGVEAKNLQHKMSLEKLGIDSMLQIELIQKLKQVFPLNLDHSVLESMDTVGEVVSVILDRLQITTAENVNEADSETSAAEMTTHRTDSAPSSSSASDTDTQEIQLVALQVTSEQGAPLILFPDGSGLTKHYSQLRKTGRNVYAAVDGRGPDVTFGSIRESGVAYASIISGMQQPPLILCGWSFGGIVALETAHQLFLLGQQIRGLILIDAPYPVDHTGLPTEVVSYILNDGRMPARQPNAMLMARFQHAAKLLEQYVPPKDLTTWAPSCEIVMLRSAEVFDTKTRCGVDHPWLSSQEVRDQAVKDWEGLLGCGIKVLSVPGDHFQPFQPQNVGKTSEQIVAACEYIDDAYRK